jgi:hypothetical protein
MGLAYLWKVIKKVDNNLQSHTPKLFKCNLKWANLSITICFVIIVKIIILTRSGTLAISWRPIVHLPSASR